MAKKSFSLTQSGNFVIGCNYWASHAGTHMWRQWRPDVVEKDLRRLAKTGMQVLRVFPLWPDFQPLTLLRGVRGNILEARHGEEPLAPTDAGHAGVDPVMMDRFAHLLDVAGRCGMKVVVGLVTGWMSGRLFVPPAIEGRNLYSDPLAVMWQVRFVQHFVRTFRSSPHVLAWNLGNECNCMWPTTSREEAWMWTATIVNAVRSQDTSRPVVSGMHSLLRDDNHWTITDQGELLDVLTTHPYPIFTQYCDQDPVNTIRTQLHATAESRAYADLGGKPCLAEELGTLGPMVASDRIAGDFVRANLFSLWANDCHGLLWWCAFDQDPLGHAPYDLFAAERELGLMTSGGAAKPVAREMKRFGEFLGGLPFEALPPRVVDAVCILHPTRDTWASAYSSFVLAKQAGLDIEFQHNDQPLKDAPLYLLPSISSQRALSRRQWLALQDKVRDGAWLYMSYKDAFLAPFNGPLGLELQSRARHNATGQVVLDGATGKPQLTASTVVRLGLKTTTAKTLGHFADGDPAFTVADYGKGKIFFLAFPMEVQLAQTPNAFHKDDAQPYWRIYDHIARQMQRGRRGQAARIAGKDSPMIGLTEHVLDRSQRVLVMVNHGPTRQQFGLTLQSNWKVAKVLNGQAPAAGADGLTCRIGPNDAMVLVVKKR